MDKEKEGTQMEELSAEQKQELFGGGGIG